VQREEILLDSCVERFLEAFGLQNEIEDPEIEAADLDRTQSVGGRTTPTSKATCSPSRSQPPTSGTRIRPQVRLAGHT
jgi:hypothetical protein